MQLRISHLAVLPRCPSFTHPLARSLSCGSPAELSQLSLLHCLQRYLCTWHGRTPHALPHCGLTGAVAPETAALAASTRIAAVQIIGPSNCAGRCHDAAPRRHVEYLCAWHATSGAAETHESSRAHNSTARWCGAAAAEQARNARFSSCASHLVRASQLAHTSHLVRLTSASHQSKRRSTACCVPKAWMPARRGSGADSRIGW